MIINIIREPSPSPADADDKSLSKADDQQSRFNLKGRTKKTGLYFHHNFDNEKFELETRFGSI